MDSLLHQNILNALAHALVPVLTPAIEKACSKALKEESPSQTSSPKEFLTDPEAREFLGGISRSLFHKLKRGNKFPTYHCGEGRCLYHREDLISYIKTNKPSAK